MTWTATVPYIDNTDADSVVDELFDQGYWSATSEADKTRYLQAATKLIDRIAFVGYKTDPDQVREFPRGGDTDIPAAVQEATVLIAVEMSKVPTLYASLFSSNVQKEKIGDADWTYFQPGDVTAEDFVTNDALNLLAPWILSPRRIDIRRA